MEIDMKTIVLMYHGLFDSQDECARTIIDEDRPYAISREKFRWQLEQIKRFNDTRDSRHKIVITFDDGHISNHSIALEELQRLGLTAYFFVTTDFMHNREYFCRSKEIRELRNAGMIVGSHGVSHQFLDGGLSKHELMSEFLDSKDQLEQVLGEAIDSISFPGGRYSRESIRLARDAGYTQLFGSKVGINENSDFNDSTLVMRVAIRHSTSDAEFLKMIGPDCNYYLKSRLKHSIKTVLQKSLGNRLYHGLYKSITS